MKKKSLILIVILCLFIPACSQLSAITPTPTVQPTPAPQLIEVEGRKLSIQCMGSGSPVVILESGLGVYSGTWYKVFPEVAKFTRVCLYDRYGLGSSEPGLPPHTSEHMVAALHELLAKAQVPAPYLLVGQSFGGLNIHLFASTYPQEVAGMVFVDAIHPDLDTRIEALELNQEGIKFEDILASEDQVRAAGPIPTVPIIVLRHGLPFEGGADWPTEKVEALWEELQNPLAKLSSDSKVIVAENSHHRIEEDRPDVVIAAIQEIFNKVHK
jgi:pimeloyl-ACP methyl ester carboxylesterase